VSKGVRFDTNNHNWLILYEYLSLSFSYLVFLQRNKIQKRDPKVDIDGVNNEFDIEPYNYIFNKTSTYLEANAVIHDQIRL
jgi:hypothetical protein